MAVAPGFNPIQWDCKRKGCANVKTRPKLEVFADCFPGLNNFGDVDGLVERKGAFCVLEWKTPGARLKTAQVLTFKAISKISESVVFAVEGCAEKMVVRRYSVFWKGQQSRWRDADLRELKARVKGWADRQWAPRQPASWQQALKGDRRQ